MAGKKFAGMFDFRFYAIDLPLLDFNLSLRAFEVGRGDNSSQCKFLGFLSAAPLFAQLCLGHRKPCFGCSKIDPRERVVEPRKKVAVLDAVTGFHRQGFNAAGYLGGDPGLLQGDQLRREAPRTDFTFGGYHMDEWLR